MKTSNQLKFFVVIASILIIGSNDAISQRDVTISKKKFTVTGENYFTQYTSFSDHEYYLDTTTKEIILTKLILNHREQRYWIIDREKFNLADVNWDSTQIIMLEIPYEGTYYHIRLKPMEGKQFSKYMYDIQDKEEKTPIDELSIYFDYREDAEKMLSNLQLKGKRQ